MSLNARHGHTFKNEPLTKPIGLADEAFAFFVFMPIALVFVGIGWSLIPARWAIRAVSK